MKNKRLIIGAVSIFIAGVLFLIVLPLVQADNNARTQIVRAASNIKKGALITEENIELVETGGYNLPIDIIKSKEAVVGKYAKMDMASGDAVLKSKLSDISIDSDYILNKLPDNKAAVSLSVSSFAAGVSAKLKAGDIVRIYNYMNGGINDVPQLQYVKLLAVTDSEGNNITGSDAAKKYATVTVLASSQQAKVIAEIENKGKAHIALISRDDEALADELIKKQDEYICASETSESISDTKTGGKSNG